MAYFKSVLPEKKENLIEKYSLILKYLKKAKSGLRANNVEEVQWWLGHVFITLCENKEIVDSLIYNSIVDLKNEINNNISTILFFHTRFKNHKQLETMMDSVLVQLSNRLVDLKLYNQLIKKPQKPIEESVETE